ncbi:hypothetical protein [Nostoc sp.]|uniref:hypothetical protein n=1 Tax=Nostoc sp. TaxID=1180 RepID=UPI002FFBED32
MTDCQTVWLGFARQRRSPKRETLCAIASPVVPTTEQILQQLRTGIANLPVKQIWVNPDCGLKTRRWSEVIPALKNMVEATKVLREEANATVK